MAAQFVLVWWLSEGSLGSIIRQEIATSGAQRGLKDVMHNSKSATHVYINVYITQTNARVIGQDGFFKSGGSIWLLFQLQALK